jgi:hypothetical protein
MRTLRNLLVLTAIILGGTALSQARVFIGFGFGPVIVPGPVVYAAAPACPYGYYQYYPYDCADYGYYGPEWFAGGYFAGIGPWGWVYGSPFGWYNYRVGYGYRPGLGFYGPGYHHYGYGGYAAHAGIANRAYAGNTGIHNYSGSNVGSGSYHAYGGSSGGNYHTYSGGSFGGHSSGGGGAHTSGGSRGGGGGGGRR